MGQFISLKSKMNNHDLNHDLTFYAHTFNCVCHSIRSMFRVLGMYNFVLGMQTRSIQCKKKKDMKDCTAVKGARVH